MTKRHGRKTNLVFITFDQWRGDWGNPLKPIIKLNSLNELAKDGWSAENCYTSSPQCVPARLSWITGLAPSEIGVTKNEPVNLPGDAPSLIRDLKEQGYTTGIVGKTHWSNHNFKCDLEDNRRRLEDLGFSQILEIAGPRALQKLECAITREWRKKGVYQKQMDDLMTRYQNGLSRNAWKVRESVLPRKLYPDIWVADRGIEMLENMPEMKPWLLWISFVGPHEPFDTPKPWKGKHKQFDIEEKIVDNGWIDRLNDSIGLKKQKKVWENKLTAEDIRELRNDYADHLFLLDSQIKKILTALGERNDKNDTAVLVTSDHGEMLGDHEMLYKSTFLEPSVRVPFIYKPPKKPMMRKYRSEDKEVGLTGLIKTVLTNLIDGGKLEPIQAWCRMQMGAISEYDNETMFTQNKLKIVYNNLDHEVLWATDLKRDPNEINNLGEQYKKKEGNVKEKRIREWATAYLMKKKKRGWLKLEIKKGNINQKCDHDEVE